MWENLADDTRDLVVEKGRVASPATMTQLLDDPDWAFLLGSYLLQNDPTAYEFWEFATQDPDVAAEASGDGDLEYGRANFAHQRGAAIEQLEPWLAPFLDEVQRIQAWNATQSRTDAVWAAQDELAVDHAQPGAVMVITDPAELDADYVQRVNEYSWEAVKSAGGTSFLFLASHGLLMLEPENFTPHYVETFRQANAEYGTISVDSRGGVLSRGGVTVSGVSDPAGFKRAFRTISDKSITFE